MQRRVREWKLQYDAEQEVMFRQRHQPGQHYGMQGVHNNAGRGHENGSVESAHGHLKRRICQALMLRGRNDVNIIEEYQAFITQQVMRYNRNNQDLVKKERLHLKPLLLRRSADYDELTVSISRSSTINVKHVVYSVPSRLQVKQLWG